MMEKEAEKYDFGVDFKIKKSFIESQNRFRPHTELLELFQGLDFQNSYLQVFFPSVKIFPKDDELVFLYKIVCGVNKRGKWADIENVFLNLLIFAFSHKEQVTPVLLVCHQQIQQSQDAWISIGKYLIKNWRFCRFKWVTSYVPELQNSLWKEVQQKVLEQLQEKLQTNQLAIPELLKAELSKQINLEQLKLKEVDLGVNKNNNNKDQALQYKIKSLTHPEGQKNNNSVSNINQKFKNKSKPPVPHFNLMNASISLVEKEEVQLPLPNQIQQYNQKRLYDILKITSLENQSLIIIKKNKYESA